MDSVSRANGGIFEAERRLQQSLHAQLDVDVRVVGLRDSYSESDREAWSPLLPVTYSVRGPVSFGFAPGLVEGLVQAEADLAYFAGLWKYLSIAALRWAGRTGKPFLVAPHGMLDPWALRNSGFKKQMAGRLFQNAQLSKAACLRALCPAEALSIRAYGLNNPICIIPNGIDLPEPSLEAKGCETLSPFPPGSKILLYLGRLHPKKGLAHLVSAWTQARKKRSDWVLAIAGWDQGGHEAELKRQVEELGAASDHSIVFLGPMFGAAKAEIYSHCEAFILPSFSEGLPMVILEAWAYGKPVLMTPECNLPEGFTTNSALRIESNVGSQVLGLLQLFEMNAGERLAMGQNGLALVKDRFAWPKVAREMFSVYEWMLGGGPMPGCMEAP